MTAVRLSTGAWFDLDEPDAELLTLNEIASTLAKTCRFGARLPRFYSVAEHCWWTHYVVLCEGGSEQDRRDALMHDAAETIVQDLVTPIKYGLLEYLNLERRVECALSDRFGINFDNEFVKRVDAAMSRAEQRYFYGDGGEVEFDSIPTVFGRFDFAMAESTFLRLAETIVKEE